MNTKDKLFELLNDTDKMTEIINKACDSQNNTIKASWEVHTNRRIELGKRMNAQKLECPECGTRQVQLVGYMSIIPAKWRCRYCKHRFEWEGE